ncbi:MAG: hypothetical protein AAGI01_09310 [Myxococcota bacterium]
MKHNTKTLLCTTAILVGLSSLACNMFVDKVVDRTIDTAANKVGNRVGEAVGNKIIADLTPMMQQLMVSSFNLMFYHGGYYVADQAPYAPGQYTRWRSEGETQSDFMERALLRRNSDGTEWWRVEYRPKGDKENTIMEALLSAPDPAGNRQIRRMRMKSPGQEPSEVPITESNSSTWYLSSQTQLTPESLEGMTVGDASVTVPAGTFQTRHVRFTSYQGAGELDWFMTQKVPGGVVKYRNVVRDEDEESLLYEVVLESFGEGATESKLGIDFDKQPTPAPASDESASL